MINNFEELKKICKFEPGTYYKFVALIRKKDYNENNKSVLNINERGEIFVRQWFIDSEENLNKYKDDMINLCNALKCRLYMGLNKKSVKKTIVNMQKQINDMVAQYVYNSNFQPSISKLSKFSASSSQLAECSASDKYWMLDVDYDKCVSNEPIKISFLEEAFKNYHVATLKTLNGYHLILKRKFDIHKVLEDTDLFDKFILLQYVEVKENCLTLIYKGE
ncbi:MAG: hypothetical protein NC222_06320 [Staphylococcus sp.]|nr:hypothetical protein [Staphylococcus sp.]